MCVTVLIESKRDTREKKPPPQAKYRNAKKNDTNLREKPNLALRPKATLQVFIIIDTLFVVR